MTGSRDIGRTLDAWFVDGPTMMPDRLFDAVLDQVERTPQQPLARLRLRLTEMNPRIRVYTLLAAALLIVIATIAVIGGGSRGPVSSTDAPTDGPSDIPFPAAVDIPAELAATWMGSHRAIDGVDPDAGVTLEIAATATVYLTESASATKHLLQSEVAAIDADGFRLVTTSDVRACSAGDAGEYGWSVSSTGRVLEITLVSDDCTSRADGVPGTYWLMDCPTEGDNCLGPLDAGTFSSQFIDPFLGTGESWSPRFGAVTYTVPEGWVNVDDWPGNFTLHRAIDADDASVSLVTDVVISEQAKRCSELQDPDIGTTAAEMTTFLSTAEGLLASDPAPVTVGGLTGFSIDISLDPSWTRTCSWSDGRPVRALLADRSPAEGYAWAMEPGHEARLYFLDLGDGRALMISVESPLLADFGGLAAAAAPVIDSFVFTP